jgi:phosphate ABC transporter permease protein PstC
MRKERAIDRTLLIIAFSALGSLALITVFIFQAGIPLFADVGLGDFVGGASWRPSEGEFGILPMIVGSLCVTAGALLLGVPLGLAVAVFTTEMAPPAIAAIARPTVQLLAGIPSVIYGFIGLTVLAPWVRQYVGGPGLGILTASLVLGIMILPNIISISEDAIRAVPQAYRDGSLALGATHWQTIWRVVLPAARSGIVASIILGMGRALGETMAVIMMVGNALDLPRSALDSVTTMTSNIGLEMAYASGQHRQALFAIGVFLFILIMILNSIAIGVSRRRGGARNRTRRWRASLPASTR